MCVRECVSLEKLSADAGSLGHLASAKEKGKLFHRAGRGGRNRNFQKNVYFMFGKYKETLHLLFGLFFKRSGCA